jgi:3-carboxy-cis,cis-muconate cycloisomerase
MLAATTVAALPQEHERAKVGGDGPPWRLIETLGSAVQAMDEVAAGLTIDADAMQANMDATEGAVLAERATFLLAEKMGKQKAGKLVEAALAKGGSFVEALGQLEKELSDEAALLGYSPKFVDRLLAELRRKYARARIAINCRAP